MALLNSTPVPGCVPRYSAQNFREEMKRVDAELDRLQAISDALPEGEVVDGLLLFPQADGYAIYRVLCDKPLTLQHVPYMDGYTVSDATIRGLTRSDVQAMLDRRRALKGVVTGVKF